MKNFAALIFLTGLATNAVLAYNTGHVQRGSPESLESMLRRSTIPRITILAPAGERVEMRCQAITFGANVERVTWRKSGENTVTVLTVGNSVLSPDDRISIDVNEARKVWTLHIDDVTEADEGQYECLVLYEGHVTPAIERMGLTVRDPQNQWND